MRIADLARWSRWEAALIGSSFASLGMYWLARTGQYSSPVWNGMVRNQLGDFGAVVLGTSALLLVGNGVTWLRSHPRHSRATRPNRLRWMLLAPLAAWIFFSGSEVLQHFGIHWGHGGRFFDWRDLVAEGLAGLLAAFMVVKAQRAHTGTIWQPGRLQSAALVALATTLLAVTTGAAAGGHNSAPSGQPAAPSYKINPTAMKLTVDTFDGGIPIVIIRYTADRLANEDLVPLTHRVLIVTVRFTSADGITSTAPDIRVFNTTDLTEPLHVVLTDKSGFFHRGGMYDIQAVSDVSASPENYANSTMHGRATGTVRILPDGTIEGGSLDREPRGPRGD